MAIRRPSSCERRAIATARFEPPAAGELTIEMLDLQFNPATRFYTELLSAFPDIRFDLQEIGLYIHVSANSLD